MQLRDLIGLLILVVSALGLFIVNRGMRFAVRERCGKPAALRLVAASNGAILLILAFGIPTRSITLFVVAGLIFVLADLFPEPIIMLTGGRTSVICELRWRIHELMGVLGKRPYQEADARAARRIEQRLDLLRSPTTSRTIDALVAVVAAQTPVELDHAETLKAYDELDAALAELKAAHPW